MNANSFVIFSDKAVGKLIKSVQTSAFLIACAGVYIFFSEKKKRELNAEIKNLKKEIEEHKREEE